MKRALILLFLLPVLTYGQFFRSGNDLINTTFKRRTDANMLMKTVSVGGTNYLNVLIREPKNINSPPSGGWPIILFYGGDGTDAGATTTVTNSAMSGGPTTWTLTGANSSSNRILSTSVIIKNDGLEIARGLLGGQIRGRNVSTGSVALTNSSSAFTFTSSVSLTGSVTVDYVYSTLLLEGAPLVFNQGDTDDRAIFVAVQNDANDTDFTNVKHFDPIIKFLYNNYTINPNRIHVSGISRGGRYIMRPNGVNHGLIEYRPSFYITPSGQVSLTNGDNYVSSGIASATVSAPDIGGSYTVTNSNGVGLALVQGTSDGTLINNLIGHVTTWGAQTLTEYPYTQSFYGVDHNGTIWHTNHYYRLWRTDATGTAEWDWLDFQLRYSKDLNECATLFVEQAERRRYNGEKDIIDYREAVRKVNELSSGDLKTSLQSRLATLKAKLDAQISWRAVIVHTNGSYPISTTGYNEINNHADFQSTGTLVDDNGNTLTGISWAVGDNPQSSNYQTEITSNRGLSSVGGFPFDVNRVGMRIGSTDCPVGFTGLSSGTYTLRIYFNEGSGSYTQKEITATINGVTRTQFAQINRLVGYVEWTGLSSSDLSSYSIGRNTADIYVTAEEIIKN